MKRKSMIAMVMAAAMVIGLTACGNSGESSENAAPESEAAPSSQEQQEESEDSSTGAVNTTDGLIGISVPSADHGWTAGAAYYAQQKCEELGLEEGEGYRLLTADSVNDQGNDLDELINMGCTSIVMLPHNDEVSVAAQRVLDAGINLIVFDRKITGDYTAYLAGDNAGIGVNGADYIGEALNGKGTVAVMSAPSVGSVSVDRTEAFKEEVAEKYPDLELIDVTAEGFTQEAGLTMASDMLIANGHIDAVFSIDDEPSLGILQAIIEAGRTDIKYISGGGGAQSWYEKIESEKDITLFTETYSPAMIGDAIALAQRVQRGEEFEKETTLPNNTVDASNVKEFLDENSPY